MDTLLANLPEVLLSLAGLIAGFVVPYHIDQRMKEQGPAMAPVTTVPDKNPAKNTRALDTAPGARVAPASAYEAWLQYVKDDTYAKIARERAERLP